MLGEIRIHSARLWVLRLLEAMPGRRGNDDFMHSGLDRIGLPLAHAELVTQLHFLAEKGLIQLDYVDDFTFKVWAIELTRTGQEVVAGLVEVDGIERLPASL